MRKLPGLSEGSCYFGRLNDSGVWGTVVDCPPRPGAVGGIAITAEVCMNI